MPCLLPSTCLGSRRRHRAAASLACRDGVAATAREAITPSPRRFTQIKLSCIAKLGCGKEHAKWTPVSKCAFRPKPTISWDDNAVSALPPNLRNIIVDVCPAGVLGYEDERDRTSIVVKNEAAILDFTKDIQDLTKQLSPQNKPMFHASASTTDFVFEVESLGGVPVDDCVLCGLNEIKRKLTNLQVAVAEVAAEQA